MSDCADCEELTRGYGAPDRRCEQHWREDHPNGFSMKFTVTAVNRDVIERYFGVRREDHPQPVAIDGNPWFWSPEVGGIWPDPWGYAQNMATRSIWNPKITPRTVFFGGYPPIPPILASLQVKGPFFPWCTSAKCVAGQRFSVHRGGMWT